MDFNIREIKAMTTIAVYAAAIDGEFDKSEMMVVAEHICALVNSKEEAYSLGRQYRSGWIEIKN